MAYRLAPNVPLVIAKDQDGRLHHHYAAGASGLNRGPYIPWLNDEQRAHFLRRGLVVEVDTTEAPTMPSSDAVGNCVAALGALGVDVKAGRPAAAKALRDAGHKFSNETIAGACQIRRSPRPPVDEIDDLERR